MSREDIKKKILEWVTNFLKNKDIFHNKIMEIIMNVNGFDAVVKYKDGEQFIIIMPTLEDITKINFKSNDDHILLATLNSRENLKIIVENWQELIKFKNLCIYFINPFSSLEKKWIVFPYTHDKICDKGTLKQGLNSMFEMVEAVSEGEFESKI